MDKATNLNEIFSVKKPIIGMVHLRPLPGSPLYDPKRLNMGGITEIALEDSEKLLKAGVDGLQIENIWDYPYLKGNNVGYETTSAMSAIASKIKQQISLPIGINIHLNAGVQAFAVAAAVGAKWIRVFEWVNAYVSHAGFIEGIGSELARYRSFLKADEIKFFCDVNVKHGSHFIVSDRTIAEQAHDAESEGADILIVTGFETGKAPSPEKVHEFSLGVSLPILIGSGMTTENIRGLLTVADGAIVGSYFKKNNDWKEVVDEKVVCKFMDNVKRLREDL